MIKTTKEQMARILLRHGYFKYGYHLKTVDEVVKSLSYKEIKDYYNEFLENSRGLVW